jgi:hypothetical protein
MNYFYKVLIIIFLNGVTAALAQIVLGREISFQVVMDARVYSWMAAAWIFGAFLAGQFVYGRFIKKAADEKVELVFGMSPVINTFLIPAALYLIRFFKPALNLAPAASDPLWAQALLCLVVFIPVSALVITGVLAGVDVLIRTKAQGQINQLYLFEGAGIFISTVFYFTFLKSHYDDIDIIYTLGLANLTLVYVLFRGKTIGARYTMLAVITAAIVYFGFNIAGVKEKAEVFSSRAAYGGYTIIADKEYPTVKFTMAKKDNVYFVFEDGKLSYMVDDPRYEKIAWMAEGPKVLVVNGGLAGMTTALAKLKGIRDITAVEKDRYTAFLLQNILKPEVPKGITVRDLSGDITQEHEFTTAAPAYNSVVVNFKAIERGAYNAAYFAKIRKMTLQGGTLVMALGSARDEAVLTAIKSDFTSVTETDGVIIAK